MDVLLPTTIWVQDLKRWFQRHRFDLLAILFPAPHRSCDDGFRSRSASCFTCLSIHIESSYERIEPWLKMTIYYSWCGFMIDGPLPLWIIYCSSLTSQISFSLVDCSYLPPGETFDAEAPAPMNGLRFLTYWSWANGRTFCRSYFRMHCLYHEYYIFWLKVYSCCSRLCNYQRFIMDS